MCTDDERGDGTVYDGSFELITQINVHAFPLQREINAKNKRTCETSLQIHNYYYTQYLKYFLVDVGRMQVMALPGKSIQSCAGNFIHW